MVDNPLYSKPNFKIVRSVGDLKVVETSDGIRKYRSEKLSFRQIGRSVLCAPYDNHFIFEDLSHIGWTLFCTCGSPAAIVGYQVYKDDASPTPRLVDTIPGELLVCIHHATYGKHLDGSS